MAQRVLDALVSPLPLSDREVAIGASVGIALTDRADTKADRLLADADAAMYRAKREGKGCYRVFEAVMHTAAVERMNLEQELRTAIRDGALTVYYQPIVDTSTGHVTSFEALARWPHPTRGFVPPTTFIPLAEESGLIIDLGRAVLLAACEQAREWHVRMPERRPSISVNASRLQLASPSFVEDVADALARAGLEPSSLIVEVTESILASESGHVIATLDELRRTGIRVAIDDFGTGYSSFAALAELPIDILKIDKRFVDNLVFDDQGRGFVNAIMQLAHTLHLETTAEGVEQIEQRDALALLGCTHIQGYLFSPPMPGDQTHDYLARGGERHRPALIYDAFDAVYPGRRLATSRGLHAVSPHQSQLRLSVWGLGRCPELLQVLEVAVQGGSVEDEEPSGLGTRVPEGVRFPRWHQYERPVRTLEHFAGDTELHRPIQDEIRLFVPDVGVGGRHAPAGGQGPLHQGESTLCGRGRGLEPHLAPPRLAAQSFTALPTDHDTSRVRCAQPARRP